MVQVSCSLALFCIPRHQRCRASCRSVFSGSATPRDKALHVVKSPLASKSLSIPRLEPVSPTWPQISQERGFRPSPNALLISLKQFARLNAD